MVGEIINKKAPGKICILPVHEKREQKNPPRAGGGKGGRDVGNIISFPESLISHKVAVIADGYLYMGMISRNSPSTGFQTIYLENVTVTRVAATVQEDEVIKLESAFIFLDRVSAIAPLD